uniref:ShKT domain-containing protein n=1 Tax=Panagrolaimus sp. PS1159 TaxID=55785 RepID=A0AC35GTY4_9BILA
MTPVFFVAVLFIVSCNAQITTTPLTTTVTTIPGCIGNCIGGDCPVGYACNVITQQCCLSSSSTSVPTSGITCVDKIGPKGFSDCPQRAFLCNNTLYYTLMTDQCPKTCGRVDKTKADGTSDCPGLTRLCNNPTYYNLMTDQCPKTCGRCGASTIASTISVGRK